MRKEHKSKTGGLTAKGRAHFKRTEGANLKPPVKKGKNPRRVSFAARFAGMKGPMKKKGKPTRKALALRKWGFGSVAAARKFAANNKKSQEDYIMPMGKGTYGSKKGRPPKKSKLTAGQKRLPAILKKKIMKGKKK